MIYPNPNKSQRGILVLLLFYFGPVSAGRGIMTQPLPLPATGRGIKGPSPSRGGDEGGVAPPGAVNPAGHAGRDTMHRVPTIICQP